MNLLEALSESPGIISKEEASDVSSASTSQSPTLGSVASFPFLMQEMFSLPTYLFPFFSIILEWSLQPSWKLTSSSFSSGEEKKMKSVSQESRASEPAFTWPRLLTVCHHVIMSL